MLPGWHVYEGWVLGHNRIHHAFTVREGYDFVWHPYTPEQYRAMRPWQRARHRLEWSWLGAGFYYMREVWWHKMVVGKPPARWVHKVRRDRWLVLAFVVTAGRRPHLDRLGPHGLSARHGLARHQSPGHPVHRVLVLHRIARARAPRQPEIRWWKRREWTKFKGQMDGTTILRARYGLNFFFHWIMVHIPHHVDMRIPMYNLERRPTPSRPPTPTFVHDEPLRFADFVRNTRCASCTTSMPARG
jgi:hypothetical protein